MKPPYASLLRTARMLLGSGGSRDEVLGAVCHLLKEEVPHYDWVGIYLADERKRVLRLGPFAGAETEHTVIPYGKGICGQVAQSHRTFVVPDVAAQDNYLSCSAKVRSEMVVPIMRKGRFAAQLDIDSHKADAFSDEDREFLEALASDMAAII